MRDHGSSGSATAGRQLRRSRRRVGASLLLGLVTVVGLAGCGGSDNSAADGAAPAGAPVDAADGLTRDEGGEQGGGSGAGGDGALVPEQRSVIATASILVRVDDVVLVLPRVTGVAAANGGYVAGEDTATDPDDPTQTTAVVVLRVPTDRMPAALEQLAGFGDVLSRQQEVVDVTEQVVDVESRAASARASVERIRLLLDRAQSISDIVRIEGELSRREADLESLLAQQRSLQDRTEYATVTATLVGSQTPAPIDDDSGFLVGLEKGWDAFTAAVSWSLTLLGALLPFLVLAVVVAVPLLAVWRRRSDRKAGRRSGVKSGDADAVVP